MENKNKKSRISKLWDAPESKIELSKIKEVLSDEISKGNIKLKNITLYDLISEMDDTPSCDFGPG